MWENSVDLVALHINRAKEENLNLSDTLEVLSIDDHKIHIDEHTAYILSSDIKNRKDYQTILNKLLEHIEKHKTELTKQQKTNQEQNSQQAK